MKTTVNFQKYFLGLFNRLKRTFEKFLGTTENDFRNLKNIKFPTVSTLPSGKVSELSDFSALKMNLPGIDRAEQPPY